jgi:cyclophilin family peptidyl-prolyl cis-trans isomerase
LIEILEARQLLAASLATIPDISAPAQLGYQVSLNGSVNTDPSQTYAVTSDNPRIAASIAQGPFWTLNVQHASSGTGDPAFAGALTFQLFQDLTPNTVSHITQFTTNGYYNGKDFTRIANNFPGPTDFIAQGGAPNADGSGNSGLPGTPFADEFVQQLAFTVTGTQQQPAGQLAMANAGPNTNDVQFFVTTGTPTFLDFKHTIFGQLVAGSSILTQMTHVATTTNSLPVDPIVINSATLSQANVNGVVHIDTTSARAGDTANITVTATDPQDGSRVTQSFKVTVVAYNGPTSNVPINFIPVANFQNASTPFNTAATIQLQGQGSPDTTNPGTLSYAIVSPPSHGSIGQFDPATGMLVYTPANGFRGIDTLQYQVTATYTKNTPVQQTSLPATVFVLVGFAQTQTGAVRLIDNTLVVTPLPQTRRAIDNIQVSQYADPRVAGGQKILVLVNNVPDTISPASSSLNRIVVFGTKASDNIAVDPNVTVPTTLDGGHGGRNVVKGGGGTTLEHGWFGHTVLVGGVGPNELIGRKGIVRFKPSSSTGIVFAGVPKPRNANHQTVSPGGTFYRFVHGHLVPVWSLGSASAPTTHTRSRHPRSTKK